MNHTKKMAAGLLALLLAGGVLAGCGGQSREDAIGALTNTETPTAAAKATPTANAEDEFEAGVCTDAEYTNAWIGLKFTATDDMTMQTKEQIQDSQEAGAELLQVEQSSNANVVTEMAAVTPEGNNINISAVKDQSGVITPLDVRPPDGKCAGSTDRRKRILRVWRSFAAHRGRRGV